MKITYVDNKSMDAIMWMAIVCPVELPSSLTLKSNLAKLMVVLNILLEDVKNVAMSTS